MTTGIDRRTFVSHAAAWGLISVTTSPARSAAEANFGAIAGEPTAERAGRQVLVRGGNAIDALVAAALTAGVAAPHQTGLGGYGGTLVVAPADGRAPAAIDFNTEAPQAAQADMFQPGPDGKVHQQKNDRGWLACSVPGVLAGLQLALDRYGTRSLAEMAQPAIALARDGIVIDAPLAAIFRNHAPALAQDPASRQLYLRDGKPPKAGDTLRNPELAEVLATLAARNSVESFYRGDLAQQIVAAFSRGGGMVTAQDLAGYRPRETAPLALKWGDQTIHTAPLTAGGLTVLQALHTLLALKWTDLPAGLPRTHARIEALRLAWRDRLTLLGDPLVADVPLERLLSAEYAGQSAERVRAAVEAGRPLAIPAGDRVDHGGTIHLSAVDRQGMLAAVTLTHGNSFGARVTIPGLGITLGHGMSRFEPRPGHANSPAPGKRPLHNMCPTIVLREGRPWLAAGGRGGRKIVSALFDFLLPLVALDASPADAIAAPRMHTEGDLALALERSWPTAEAAACRELGFAVTTATSAILSAAWRDADGVCQAALR